MVLKNRYEAHTIFKIVFGTIRVYFTDVHFLFSLPSVSKRGDFEQEEDGGPGNQEWTSFTETDHR